MGLERAEIGTKKGTNQGQEGQSSGRRRARGLTAFPEAPVAGQQGLRQGLSRVVPFFIIIWGHPRQGVLHTLPGVQQLLSHLLTCNRLLFRQSLSPGCYFKRQHHSISCGCSCRGIAPCCLLLSMQCCVGLSIACVSCESCMPGSDGARCTDLRNEAEHRETAEHGAEAT